MLKKTNLKCDCGSTSFKVAVVGENKLVLTCAAEGCNNFFEISHDPSLQDITHAVANNLGDLAVQKIGEFILNGGLKHAKRKQ